MTAPKHSLLPTCPLDSITGIEQMACTDGCTEYELSIGDGVLTLDIKQERGVNNDESKIA